MAAPGERRPPCAERDAQVFAVDTALRRDAGAMAPLWDLRLMNTLLDLATNTQRITYGNDVIIVTGPRQYERACDGSQRIVAWSYWCRGCPRRSVHWQDVYPVAEAAAPPRGPIKSCVICFQCFCDQCLRPSRIVCITCSGPVRYDLMCTGCADYVKANARCTPCFQRWICEPLVRRRDLALAKRARE